MQAALAFEVSLVFVGACMQCEQANCTPADAEEGDVIGAWSEAQYVVHIPMRQEPKNLQRFVLGASSQRGCYESWTLPMFCTNSSN